MANYRTTVILKTDIVDSTPRLAEQTQLKMGAERKQHKQFTANIATKYRGSIFQDEGDAYWIEFPSVTDAVLAAIEMHQNLRYSQAGQGDKKRLAIRAVVTVGDLLHQENDLIGMTMNLTARIEKVTPADETYLSHAAWLILNKAEVQTSPVGEFGMKGFSETEKIYRVDQKHRTRVITGQYILFTDVRGWSSYTKHNTVEEVEHILMEYDDLLIEICNSNNGIIRNASGDQYFLTFSEAENLFQAIETLCARWKSFVNRYHLGLSIAVHKGDLNIIRSYLYSNDIHTTYFLEVLSKENHPGKETISVITSKQIMEAAKNTTWENAFQIVDIGKFKDTQVQSIAEEYGVYEIVIQDN